MPRQASGHHDAHESISRHLLPGSFGIPISFPPSLAACLSVSGSPSLAPSFDGCLRRCGSGGDDCCIAQYCPTSVKNLAPISVPAIQIQEIRDPQAYWARGYAYGELKRFDEERAELAKALVLSPNDSQYLNELAFVYVKTGKWQLALDNYQEADKNAELTSPQPKEVKCVSLRGLGYVLVEMGRLDDAEAKYQACVKLIPGEPKSLAEIKYIQGEREKRH
jgi:tetratricopeptide (TPR) repeat protein